MKRHSQFLILITMFFTQLLCAQNTKDTSELKINMEEIVSKMQLKKGVTCYWNHNQHKYIFLHDTIYIKPIPLNKFYSEYGNLIYTLENDTIIKDSLNWFTYNVMDSIELISFGKEALLGHLNTDLFIMKNTLKGIRNTSFCANCNPHYMIKYYFYQNMNCIGSKEVSPRKTLVDDKDEIKKGNLLVIESLEIYNKVKYNLKEQYGN